MATISEALAIAVQHHRAGRLKAAEQVYRQILFFEPNQVDAIHFLGVLAHQVGNHEIALECLKRAIGLKGNDAAFHCNLAKVYHALHRIPEAISGYHRALELTPDFLEAQYGLGNALYEQGNFAEAIACYGKVLELKPDFAEVHSNRGNAFQLLGKLDDAVACYQRALELKPAFAEMHNNLGSAFSDQGKLAEAVACYQRALELKPDFAEAHSNLGSAFRDLGKREEAVACYRRALKLKPDFAGMHDNLGGIFTLQGKLDDAIACYRRALELNPNCAEYHNNLGIALRSQEKLEDAVACFHRALEIKPIFMEALNNLGVAAKDQGKLDQAEAYFRNALELNSMHAEVQHNQSLLKLLRGDFANGWWQYEWRWQRKETPPREFPQPRWDGGDLAGKTILVHAEQGLGDTIQFVRFVPLLKMRGAKVILEVQKPLLPLLAGFPADEVVARGTELPNFDTHAPLLSLPGIFKTNLENIPAAIPYLFASSQLVDRWRDRLRPLDGFRIGIAWQGNPAWSSDRYRSARLAHFAALAECHGIHLISLQKGAGADQLSDMQDRFPVMDLSAELDANEGPFMDTAAIMMNLDLVVTIDSAIGHLAGALGVPVWIALSLVPHWCWMLDREDSPWYPTMRLFRQRGLDDWAGVFDEMQAALQKQISVGHHRKTK